MKMAMGMSSDVSEVISAQLGLQYCVDIHCGDLLSRYLCQTARRIRGFQIKPSVDMAGSIHSLKIQMPQTLTFGSEKGKCGQRLFV